MQLSELERKVYRRYADLALPRHTSYPAVPFWRAYGEEEFRAALERSNRHGRDLSIYLHVPFCERLCYYCTCTKQVLPRHRAIGDQHFRRRVRPECKIARGMVLGHRRRTACDLPRTESQ